MEVRITHLERIRKLGLRLHEITCRIKTKVLIKFDKYFIR